MILGWEQNEIPDIAFATKARTVNESPYTNFSLREGKVSKNLGKYRVIVRDKMTAG